MIIPSFWNSLHDEHVYPEPDKFIPERWMPLPEGGIPLAEQSPQNYLVWGSGPHKVSRSELGEVQQQLTRRVLQCIGVQYASMHLAAVIGSASVLMNWEHERTKDSDKVQVIAT